MRFRRRFALVLLFLTVVLLDGLLSQSLYRKLADMSGDNLDAVWQDIVYFPVPESTYGMAGLTVTYADSWMDRRSYGGERVHEGCDIMASENERGHYPVVSISDGVVEKLGWLKLGGYRVGIRSPHGAYFYYAHLNDYAEGLAEGDEVRAGELLGFMGDTGYGEEEGTKGNFPVHLHVGIYLDDGAGGEESCDPYPFLQELEGRRLKYAFE